jgi:DNA primase
MDLLDLIQEDVGSVRLAGKEHKAKCPLHQDNTPSLYINVEKGKYYCFSCNEGGDAIEWLRRVRGMSFSEAQRHLGEDARTPREPSWRIALRARERANTADFSTWCQARFLRMLDVLLDVEQTITSLERVERFELTADERETLHRTLDSMQLVRQQVIRRMDVYDPNPLVEKSIAKAEWEAVRKGRS